MQDDGHTGTGVLRPEDGATVISPLGPVSSSVRVAPVAGERIGPYVVQRTLGRGGMGVVVAAQHERRRELVAIKLLHAKAAKDAVQRERFVREARAIVRIKSDHVVRVLDAGVEEATGAPYIVMEHLEGLDLGQMLVHHGALTVPMAVDCMIQICEAVAAAHALGIIHRDLKPSNFFVTKSADGAPLVKVLDFGISKAGAEDGIPDPQLTETQAVFGSPTYMSPEQIRSSKNVDARSDVWSLGVALFELLTKKLPFVADNVAGLLASVVADPPFPLAQFAPAVPAELEAIVLACLEKDPARRIGSAAELAVRLAPFASPEGARLASRIELAARGSSNSLTPPPPLGGSPRQATFPPSGSMPSVPPPAFGTTETDLSASGPSELLAHRNTARRMAIAFAVVGGIGVVVAVTVSVMGMGRDEARAPATSAASAAPAPEPILPPATAPSPPVASAAPPVASVVPAASGRRPRHPRSKLPGAPNDGPAAR
ncbi:MAG TPA: protein kinase, partial [Labilithrix sp.]|nr:protein kinase [Labilithrix sp.]